MSDSGEPITGPEPKKEIDPKAAVSLSLSCTSLSGVAVSFHPENAPNTFGIKIESKDGEKKDSRGDDKEDEDKDSKDDKDSDEKDKDKKKEPPLYKRPAFVITAIVILLVLIIGGLLYWLHARQYASTDDAYIDGHIVQISPRVSALVNVLHIEDNQLVHQGDLLIELDPTDYQVALDQAKASEAASQGKLLQAQAQVPGAKAAVLQAKAEVNAAQVALDKAKLDHKRYLEVDERARSQQQLDDSTTAEKNAEAQLAEAAARQTSAEANIGATQAAIKAAEGDELTAQANVKKAEVNLSYCRIVAPTDGRVTERTVEAGDYLQTGQVMFMLVSPDVWVTANYKETQLTYMRPGQPVTITVDAFSGMKLHGRVNSIQAGSGSRFSVLPAENATGNFVKIVQRVPVKITFDLGDNTNDARLLSPGLSVIPTVKVR
jgi:membrane fusion protein (multidrug efflux system)